MPGPRRHILLLGFMGSGKSTVGPLLASRLRLPYAELDTRIEERYALPISEIFKLYGEEAFRRAEGWELLRLLLDPPSVIALGGGAFHRENRRLLGSNVCPIWLDVSLEQAWERCGGDPGRPLASNRESFADLYRSRQTDYRSASIRVAVDQRTPDSIVDEIRLKLHAD